MTTACKNCPFRIGSIHGYTRDGLEALADGCEPSCHMVVGEGKQFIHNFPTKKQRCHGYDLWAAGSGGFQEPYLV